MSNTQLHRSYAALSLEVDSAIVANGDKRAEARDVGGALRAFEASYLLSGSTTSLVSLLYTSIAREPFLACAGLRALLEELRAADPRDKSLAAEQTAVKRKLDEAQQACAARRQHAAGAGRSAPQLAHHGHASNAQGNFKIAYQYFGAAYALDAKPALLLSMCNMKLKSGWLAAPELVLRYFDRAIEPGASLTRAEAQAVQRKHAEAEAAVRRARGAQLAVSIAAGHAAPAHAERAAELAARMRAAGHAANRAGEVAEAHACFQAAYALVHHPADGISIANMKLKSADVDGGRDDLLELLATADAPPKGVPRMSAAQRKMVEQKLEELGGAPRAAASAAAVAPKPAAPRAAAAVAAAPPPRAREDEAAEREAARAASSSSPPNGGGQPSAGDDAAATGADAGAPREPSPRPAAAAATAAAAAAAGGAAAPSGPKPLVRALYAAATSAGGSSMATSERHLSRPNQDSYFAHPTDAGLVVGVLDGHGGTHGAIASQAAARAMEGWFDAPRNSQRLVSDAQGALASLFLDGHVAVLDAIGRATGAVDHARKWSSGGADVDALVSTPLDPKTKLPAEGGTTATVVALVDGHLLLIAHVGDSDAVLGGEAVDGGGVSAEKLTSDHTPCSVSEFKRTRALQHNELQFVYDCPTAELLRVFAEDERTGEVEFSDEAAEQADLRGVGYKSVRAERPALVTAPPPEGGEVGPRLAVTRSLGDPHLQTCGLTWKPEVTLLDLSEPAASLEPLVLIVGSDGLWDLFAYEEAIDEVLQSGYDLTTQDGVSAACEQLLATTKTKGEELLGSSTDDTTIMVISFVKN